MITIQGKGVSKGIAKGPLYFFQRPDTTVTLKVVSDIDAEKARLALWLWCRPAAVALI